MPDVYLYGPAASIRDIILCDPTQLCVGAPVQAPAGGAGGRYMPVAPRGPWRKGAKRLEPVVVAVSLMDDLVVRYGVEAGRAIYFAMEREHKGPFAPGNKYDSTIRDLQPVEVETLPERAPVIGHVEEE